MHAASEKASGQADAAQTESPAETQTAAARESPQQTPLWATRLAPAVQFALQVNAPRDPFEQEADRVAEAVMRAPDPAPPSVSRPVDAGPFKVDESDRAEVEEELRRAAGQVAPAATPALQRQAEEDDESLSLLDGPAPQELAAPQQPQAKPDPAAAPEDGDEAPLDPARPGRTPLTGAELQRRLQFAAADGRPLSGAERSFFEARFGRDFSGVRLHTGGDAAELAASLRARAFTLGHHIVFNRGQYNPSNHTSRRLLAHELTHVVQQGRAPRPTGPARQAPPAPARSGLQPTTLTRALPQRAILQRAPEESKKFADIIDYKKAKKDNLESWYAQYKFFNLFKEERIYPGSQPIAYANHVYQLQMKLQEAWGYEGADPKWSPLEPGILEATVTADSTLVRLAVVAQGFKKDPTSDRGFDKMLLQRISAIFDAFEKDAPPLVSEMFAGIPQLASVNRNKLLFIQFDDRGEYVARIQKALLALNYDIGRDAVVNAETQEKEGSGFFSKDTKKAVINFQQDSGFTGKDVDGIIGQMTLRLLDKRIGAPALQASAAGGNAVLVHVPVSAEDLLADKAQIKQDLLLRALKVAFPITDDQTDVLRRSGWHWRVYQDITQSDVDLGYKKVTIHRTAYESVMGKVAKESGKPADVPVEEKLVGQTIDLLKTGKLAELNKQIKSLEKTIYNIRWSGDPEMHGRDVDWDAIRKKEAELEGLKQARQVELNRLGITLDEYEKLKSDFVATFERFAVLIAFRMLAENEIQANIEAQHYQNLDEVKAVKAVMADLAAKYAESRKLWWEAVSLEDTRGKDKAYYRDGSDYETKNTTYVQQTDNDVFSGDPTRRYNDENVSKMYEAQGKKPTPEFAGWQAQEKAIVATLQGAVKQYPILAYPKLKLRDRAATYAAESDTVLQTRLGNIFTDADEGIKPNIEATRKQLASEPSKIWELPVVVLRAQYALGVTEGVPADLVKAKQEAVANKSFWESIGLAILGIGLGLLALVSGPVGWLALGASIAVGSYDAYRTYQEITFKQETARTAIDPADALGTEDPSYFWFWVSLVSVGFDVFQAAKLIKAVAKGVELAEGVTKGLKEAKAAAELKLGQVGAAGAEGKALLKEIEEIDAALAKVSGTEFAENIKLLEPLKGNPMAVTVMSEALKDKRIVRAVTALGKLVEKDAFENALRFYAGVGRRSLDELPELVRLVKEGGLEANKRLLAELLSDPRAQRALLDTQDAKLFAEQFQAWEKAVASGESTSFVKYLTEQGLSTRLAADTKLVDMFGEAFAALPNAVKNRQILRTVEPRLLDALNAGSLSPEIRKGLEVLLNSEVLAESSRLSSAQARLQRELQILGGLIETQSDFSKVVALLDSPAARRALWEGAQQLAGKENYVALIIKANGGKLPAADVMDDLIRIGPMTDEATVKTLLSGSGEQLRKALVEFPEAVAVLKKCASPCLPPFATKGQVATIARIMSGKSNDEILRIREFLYAARSSEDSFKAALKSLETDFAAALKDVALPVLAKPPRLAVADETLRAIVDLQFSVNALNQIMKKAAVASDGPKIITDLLRVLQFEKNVKLQKFGVLTQALAEGSAAEFATARRLLDESSRFANAADGFKYSGLQKADALLSRYTLAELDALMRAKWSEGFVKKLYGVTIKVPGISNEQIADLLRRAGGKPPGDLDRLTNILSGVKASTVTADEAVKAIDAADAFAAAVAKAMRDPTTGFDAMVKLVWGEAAKVEDGVIKVQDVVGASGSAAYKTVFPPGGKVLSGVEALPGAEVSLAKIFGGAGGINADKWKVFRKVIEDADIARSIKSSIIGEMWTQANVEYYRALGYQIFREVEVTTGKVTARADIVLVKGNEMIIVECKSGLATYERGQEIIYPLLEADKFENVLLRGDEALAAKFADPKTKRVFVPRREADIVK